MLGVSLAKLEEIEYNDYTKVATFSMGIGETIQFTITVKIPA